VWFEEGDAVALLEGNEVLAAIPAWSGFEGFHGYARDCTAQSPIAWPLGDAAAIHERIARAEDFWGSWEPGHAHWPTIQDVFLRAYERVFGKHKKYFGIDGGEWPPKAIATFETDVAVVLLTLGVSIRPMPKVEMALEDPQPHRRMELGVAIDRKLASDEVVRDIASYMSAQSNLPWTLYTWLGDGHTVQCEPSPIGGRGEYAAMLLAKDPAGAPTVAMPAYRGDPVNRSASYHLRLFVAVAPRPIFRPAVDSARCGFALLSLLSTATPWACSQPSPRLPVEAARLAATRDPAWGPAGHSRPRLPALLR
jgi:hypothetical protein